MRRNSDTVALGHARVFLHKPSRQIVVDTDSIRRSSFAGDDFGADDLDDDDWDEEDDSDDFGDDDVGDDDDLGEDDLGEDDDLGDDEELGEDFAGPRRRRRKARRQAKRMARKARRQARRGRGRSNVKWGMTAVGGVQTVSEAGAATVKIRLQHDFKASDVTFTGSASGATVTSIFFGDRVVWSNSDGIDVSVFASNSFMRGLLRGQSLRAGLDITVN
ncbi:MAG: hypothetical protein ABIO70_29895, partial [Pseudomonadota bacterium]